jgi:hypothetical protein
MKIVLIRYVNMVYSWICLKMFFVIASEINENIHMEEVKSL